MTHNTGYNQEDSVLVNKGPLDRGLFLATIYHNEKDEDKNIIKDEKHFLNMGRPQNNTKMVKFSSAPSQTIMSRAAENHQGRTASGRAHAGPRAGHPVMPVRSRNRVSRCPLNFCGVREKSLIKIESKDQIEKTRQANSMIVLP